MKINPRYVTIFLCVFFFSACILSSSTKVLAQSIKKTDAKSTKKLANNPVKNAKKPPILDAESTTSVPVKVRSCQVGDDLVVSGKVQAKDFSELRSGWMSSIEKIYVSVGDRVKKGQLIALVDTTFSKRQIDFFQGYLRVLSGQIKSNELKKRLALDRRGRLKPLADKGIIPQSDLENLDRDLASIDSVIGQSKRQKDSFTQNLNELLKQVKSANFYSPIDGTITYIIADPKSIVGRVEARGRALVARIDSPGTYLSQTFLTDYQRIKIKEGDPVSISLPDQTIYQGKVSFISPIAVNSEEANEQAEEQLSAYRVDVVFRRPGAILPEGLNAQMTFPNKAAKAQRCIPWNAIEVVDGKSMLKYFDQDSGWIVKEVELGRRGRYNVELLSELPESAFLLSKLY